MLIDSFKGKYSFLSNFYLPDGGIQIKSKNVPTLEHAFQAHKTLDVEERDKVLACKSPGAAKNAGQKVTLRPDWDEVKVSIMLTLLFYKFAPGSDMADRLLRTGTAHLVEGNDWGDEFWGCVRNVEGNTPWQGMNQLGILLMQIREGLRLGGNA